MRFLSILLLMAVTISSCNLIDGARIRGNGKITTQSFDLKNFEKIDMGGDKALFIKQDSVYSVKVETDENLRDHINLNVRNGKLNISTKDGYWLSPTDEIKVMVSLPVLSNLEVSGASRVNTSEKFIQDQKMQIKLSGASEGEMTLRVPDIKIDLSGASTLSVDGESRDVTADVSGASTLNAFDLKAENTKASASGASSANVFASISLNAEASGASNIKYQGSPNVTQKSSGASDVKKAP